MSSDLAEAARRHLTRALSEATGSMPGVALGPGVVFVRGGAGEPDDDPQPHGEGALIAYRAIDALSAEEFERWRGRLSIAREGRLGAAAAEERAAAERHLSGLVEELAVAAEADRGGVVARIGGALGLYLHLGLLDDGALERWTDRAMEAFGWEDEADEADHEDERSAGDLGDPVAVLVPEPARHGGACVTCVEVRTRATVVHWHQIRDAAADDAAGEGPPLSVTDDLGTDYRSSFGGGASWAPRSPAYAVLGSTSFPVAPPPGATRLTITGDGGGWTVAL